MPKLGADLLCVSDGEHRPGYYFFVEDVETREYWCVAGADSSRHFERHIEEVKRLLERLGAELDSASWEAVSAATRGNPGRPPPPPARSRTDSRVKRGKRKYRAAGEQADSALSFGLVSCVTHMSAPDLWRTAQLLVRQHGENADARATQLVDALVDTGDRDGRRMLLQLRLAIAELQALPASLQQ